MEITKKMIDETTLEIRNRIRGLGGAPKLDFSLVVTKGRICAKVPYLGKGEKKLSYYIQAVN